MSQSILQKSLWAIGDWSSNVSTDMPCVYHISTYGHLIHWGWEPHFCVSMSHCHQQTAIVDGTAEKNFSKTKEMKGLVEHTCLHLYCGWAVVNTYKKKNLLCRHRPISLFVSKAPRKCHYIWHYLKPREKFYGPRTTTELLENLGKWRVK